MVAMTASSWTAIELALLAGAMAAALSVRPWRLLASGDLATPLLATLTLLPWLWSWPVLGALPIPLQWSGAPLAVLLLGWPLAVPVLAVAGLSTIASAGVPWQQALSTTVWAGLLPATLVLALGQAARAVFGTHPVAYLTARAFAVPLLALTACGIAAALTGHGLAHVERQLQPLVAFLLALGEAGWTCGVATLLVACRPHWLATWSDRLYLAGT
jgi:uncharacterized membrane protein